ncbi:MAG TPA: hypothetical protein VMD75_13610 [Candidatus Binataceae bacterium]|nr:hypothetical protein [Candidatus Binataceae bacterium]
MKRGTIALIMLLGAAPAFGLGVARSNAQTADGGYGATINGAGALDAGGQAMENYQNQANFGPSQDYQQGPDFRTNLDVNASSPASTDYATSDFGNATDYAPPSYPHDDFGNATDYGASNDYSNPTELPDPLH